MATHFGSYLTAVFFNRWNLLMLGGATIAAFIAPHTDVLLALVAAAELTFITAVASNSRFQRSIDSQSTATDTAKSTEDLTRRFNQLYYSLDGPAQEDFNRLRARCDVLRNVPDSHAKSSDGIDAIASSQVKGVNRLLWVYLKLLHTRATLDAFLKSTDENSIKSLEHMTRQRIEALPKGDLDDITEKKKRSLEDTLSTVNARKDNLKRAKDNNEYVELELVRIAAKLTALSELAMNRQDPALITSEVDDVARSVESTEQAIGDLQVFTGLTAEDAEAPPILNAPRLRVRG